MASQRTVVNASNFAPSVTREDLETGSVSVGMPIDRVRWAAVLAGLFTVLAALAFFAVLGIAVGFSAFTPGEPARNFGIGAGVYGAVSALISFFLGGFIAARTSAVAGRGNALLNGAMVWIVVLVLLVNVLGTGIGSLVNTATGAVGTAVQAAGAVANTAVQAAAQQPAVQNAVQGAVADAQATVEANGGVQAAATQVSDQAQALATQAVNAVQSAQTSLNNIPPQQIQQTADDVARAAWWTLVALGLSALAAILGGLAGTRHYPTDVFVEDGR